MTMVGLLFVIVLGIPLIDGSCQWIYREAYCFSACEPGAAVPVFQLASNVLDPSCVSDVVQVRFVHLDNVVEKNTKNLFRLVFLFQIVKLTQATWCWLPRPETFRIEPEDRCEWHSKDLFEGEVIQEEETSTTSTTKVSVVTPDRPIVVTGEHS
jgi:hypothetical protein